MVTEYTGHVLSRIAKAYSPSSVSGTQGPCLGHKPIKLSATEIAFYHLVTKQFTSEIQYLMHKSLIHRPGPGDLIVTL